MMHFADKEINKKLQTYYRTYKATTDRKLKIYTVYCIKLILNLLHFNIQISLELIKFQKNF